MNADEEEDSFVDELIKKKDDAGNPLFRFIDINFVCPRCKKLGKELLCEHMNGEMPRWMETRRAREVKQMVSGRPDVYLKEMR